MGIAWKISVVIVAPESIGIGMDVSPHNWIEEMQPAAIVARILAEDITTQLRMRYLARRPQGVGALGRDDIGRLEPRAKADLVLADPRNSFMMPARDPLRTYSAPQPDRDPRCLYRRRKGGAKR
jgi:cytosine/adenosine deaminase-related metal-dependent hydrolase